MSNATENKLVFTIETEREDDGRWLAEVPELPGVMVYADSEWNAAMRAVTLALRVIADEIDHGERSADDLAGISWLPPKHNCFDSDARR